MTFVKLKIVRKSQGGVVLLFRTGFKISKVTNSTTVMHQLGRTFTCLSVDRTGAFCLQDGALTYLSEA